MQICKCRHFCHSVLDKHILPTIIGQLNYQLYILHELCCIYNPLCMCPLSLNGHDSSGCVFSLSLSLSLRVPKLSYPSICQPSIFPSVLLSSIALCCTYPDFLHQSLSTSVSPSFPVSLAFSWLNVARNKFLKAGESTPLGLSCTFHFVERKFRKRDSENRAKIKKKNRARGRERCKMRNQAKIKFKANRPRRVLTEHLSHFVCLTHE